jgi:hypothetical protein
VTYAQLYSEAPYYEDVAITDGLVILRSKAEAPCFCFSITEWFARPAGKPRTWEQAVCGPECANHRRTRCRRSLAI